MDEHTRGISPAVGSVLLIAISIALTSLGAYMVFGLMGTADPAPNVVFDLNESEDRSEYYLTHETGDELDGDRVELQGTANPESLSGERYTSGTTHSFYPIAEEVKFVWSGDDTSYVLRTFEVENPLPEPDEGCEFVEDETNGGTESITISGDVVNCDVTTEEQITVNSGGVVVGDVDSELKEFDGDDADVYGSVETENVLNLQDGLITGDATSQTADVKIGNGTVEGSIEASKIADVSDSTVEGAVRADGDELKVSGSTIDGSATSQLDDTTVSNSTIEGSVAGGKVTTVSAGSVVSGDVEGSDKDTKVLDSEVGGSVVGEGTVKLDGATVDGDVYADTADFDCTDSTINGQDCGEYSPKDPDDW